MRFRIRHRHQLSSSSLLFIISGLLLLVRVSHAGLLEGIGGFGGFGGLLGGKEKVYHHVHHHILNLGGFGHGHGIGGFAGGGLGGFGGYGRRKRK